MITITETFLKDQGFQLLDGLVPFTYEERWLRQKALPDIFITLAADAAISDVIDAVYHAGAQAHARRVKEKSDDLQSLYRNAKPLPADLPERPTL
jgi:hypothetical protein